ncbi:MAG: hypothetical protein WCA19_00095 [Candidatus Acidiferrales bacterium]
MADEVRGVDAFRSIHRFLDWVPAQAVMFDWLETFYAQHVFGIEIEDEIFPIVIEMLRRTLASNDLSPELRAGARNLKHANERAKLQKARLFQQAADRLRAEGLAANELDMRVRRDITLGIEQRVGAAPGTRTQAQIEGSLSAYCEFQRRSVHGALQNPGFRFDSRDHLNDHFDGEQLLYLAFPENHFVSSDTGFNGVANTGQGPRVHIIPAAVLEDPATATLALECVIAACTPAHPAL